MSQFIQSLENRVLMSVTAAALIADAKAVTAQVSATRTALASLRAADTSFRSTLTHDIRLLNTKSTRAGNSKLIAALGRDSAVNFSRIVSDDNALLGAATVDSAMAAADGQRLLLHPAKVAYQKKLARDITLLGSIPAKLTKLENAVLNAATSIDPVYTNIMIANPSLAIFMQTSLNTEGDQTTVFGSTAVQLVSDTNQLAADLAAQN